MPSKFPDQCKIAKLKPLFKKGDKTKPKNFRPISLLPLISKVLEKIIHDQTQEFLTNNKILYKYQSGFRPQHSTDFCLSFLNNKILNGFDAGLLTGMILIDLRKAFDTIDHKILLNKMQYLNFSENTIAWFRSYLENRTFLVTIENITSNAGNLSCGVPQGSILGPLLFLIYVNDMPGAINFSELFLYADDSCIVFQDKSVKIIENKLLEDFSNLCDWFVDNKLSIHFGEDKTKSILFGVNRKLKKVDDFTITYGETEIKRHSKVTYLGCILDETLSGESMALKVISKVNNRLRFLYRKNKFLTPSLRRLLCNALIQPHFDYACTSWYPSLNKNLKKKLQTAQNKCIRFCLFLPSREHLGAEEFKKISWLNIEDRFKQNVCTNVYRFFNKKSPDCLSDVFSPTLNLRSTRNSCLKLNQPSVKSNQGLNSLSYIGPFIWNKLPDDIKTSTSVNSFKHKIKEDFLKTLLEKERDIYMHNLKCNM